MNMSRITRQQFLKLVTAGGASFLGMNSLVSGQDASRAPLVPWGRLKWIGENGDTEDWHVHPHGDIHLMDLIHDETSINLEKKWNVANVADLDAMAQYPFLFMHGELAPVLDDVDRKNLREYFLRGGFLFAEDCVNGYHHHGDNGVNDFFFLSMMDQLHAILPGAKLERLTMDHPLFHCLYHFDEWPHMQGTKHGPHGFFYEGRLVALLSPSDLHCGWTNGDVWFGAGKQRTAMQMGANIYQYAVTRPT
jgi:hypothetical protein